MSTSIIRQKTDQNIRKKTARNSIKKEYHAEINDMICDALDTIGNGINAVTPADTIPAPEANIIYQAMTAGNYTNLLNAAGTAAQLYDETGQPITNNEVTAEDLMIGAQLLYNAASDTWIKKIQNADLTAYTKSGGSDKTAQQIDIEKLDKSSVGSLNLFKLDYVQNDTDIDSAGIVHIGTYPGAKSIVGLPIADDATKITIFGIAANVAKRGSITLSDGTVITAFALSSNPLTLTLAAGTGRQFNLAVKKAADDDSVFAGISIVYGDTPTDGITSINNQALIATRAVTDENITDSPVTVEYFNNNALKQNTKAVVKSIIQTDGVAYPCFSRNKSVLNNLSTDYPNTVSPVDKRKVSDIYEAFRFLYLDGFDSTLPHAIYAVWADAYNPDHRYYRLMIKAYAGGAWSVVYDPGPIERGSLGVIDGTVTKFDRSVGGKRVIALIDFNKIPQNVSPIFSSLTDEPDCIIAQNCFSGFLPAGGTPAEIARQPIQLYPRNMPTVCMSFDDIVSPAIDQKIVDVFNTYGGGVKCGFAYIASAANLANTEKVSFYKSLQKDGYSILSHSVDGVPFSTSGLTNAQAFAKLYNSKKLLENTGFTINGWVSPSSAMPLEFIPEVKKVYPYAYTTLNGGQNNRENDPCTITRLGLQPTTGAAPSNKMELAYIKSYLSAYTITQNWITSFYGHGAAFGDGVHRGFFADLIALNAAVSTPNEQDSAFIVTTGTPDITINGVDYLLYAYSSGAWTNDTSLWTVGKLIAVVVYVRQLQDEGSILFLAPDEALKAYYGSAI